MIFGEENLRDNQSRRRRIGQRWESMAKSHEDGGTTSVERREYVTISRGFFGKDSGGS